MSLNYIRNLFSDRIRPSSPHEHGHWQMAFATVGEVFKKWLWKLCM